jgi:MFS transporter, AAHS family, 4-hydroxybenzoate transporter
MNAGDTRRSFGAVLDSAPMSRFQVGIVVLCSTVALINGFDTQAMAFVATDVATAWHVDVSAFGVVFAVELVGGLVGATVFGSAGDRFGRKPVLLLTIALFGAVSLLTPSVHSLAALDTVRFITGIGLGGALPIAISLTSEYTPGRLRTTVVGLMFCGFPLGAVFGGLCAAELMPSYGWASVFYLGGGVPLLLLPLLWWALPESARFMLLRKNDAAMRTVLHRMKLHLQLDADLLPEAPAPGSPVAKLFTGGRAAGTLLLWLILFLSLLLTYLLSSWIPVLAQQSGIGAEAATLAAVALNLGAVVGCVVIGRLADRYSASIVIGAAYLIGALAIAAIGQAGQSDAALIGTAFVAGFFSLGAQMCAVSLSASFYDTTLRTTGIGFSMGVGRVGAIVGPLLGGALIGAGISAPGLFATIAPASIGAAIATFALARFLPHHKEPAVRRPTPTRADLTGQNRRPDGAP